MIKAGVPCIPGYHGSNQDPDFLQAEASKIGYPVLLKAVKGGGGKGMRIAMTSDDFKQQLQSAKSEAMSSFGDETMLVEKYITTPRHIEVQVFADKQGNCVALGERDCSVQRRHQKILEESPAPHLAESVRQDLWEKARAAALAVNYEGAGTVEFIFDNDSGEFFFMEMNTRLQVEHPVTEMVTGEDLVRWQIIVAEGGKLPLSQEQIQARIAEKGHAIEARIYAENPNMFATFAFVIDVPWLTHTRDFIPDSGRITHLRLPNLSDTVRVDAGFVTGDDVSAHYDPMIAKLIVQGPTRTTAIQKLRSALEDLEIAGLITNVEFLKKVCENAEFVAGNVETGFIPKQRHNLFAEVITSPEVYVQAALGSFMLEATNQQDKQDLFAIPSSGWSSNSQGRSFNFILNRGDGKTDATGTNVIVNQLNTGLFDVTADGVTFRSITCTWDSHYCLLTSFLPHTRIESRIIREGSDLTLFQLGQQYRMKCAAPKWIEKALGIKDAAHSVLAPMPCKILKVDAKAGDQVKKDQVLVVIESMKMETVIRSPQDGVISRVVHQEGVSHDRYFHCLG